MPHRSKILPLLLFPATCAYRIGYLLFKRTIFRRREALSRSRVIIVGSYLSGGAGKTPLTEKIAKELSSHGNRVAVLCHAAAWDECEMLRGSSPAAETFLTRNRYALAKRLDGLFDVILCDGGLEDTRFSNADVFALRWGERAHSIRDSIPMGSCSSLESDHPGARTVSCFRKASLRGKDLPLGFSASFGISKMENFLGESLQAKARASVVTAIGNPDRFVEDVEDFGIDVSKTVFLRDHSRRYAKRLRKELLGGSPVIITEKDLARLDGETKRNPRLYVARMQVDLSRDFRDYLNAAAGGAARNPPSTL